MREQESGRKRLFGPGLGLVAGAALGTLVAILASLDVAWGISVGAGLGLVVVTVFDLLDAR